MPILPPFLINKGDIVENLVEIDEQQAMVNIEEAIVELRWSQRIHKPIILNDYVVYLIKAIISYYL